MALLTSFASKIKESDVKVLPIFRLIEERGKINRRDMFNTFNMGVGMTATVEAKDVNKAISVLRDQGVEAYALGEIVKSENGVTIC